MRCLAARAGSVPVVLVTLGIAGCINLGPGYDLIDVVAPSFGDDDEREIGLDFDRSLVDSRGVVLDPVVTDFLQRLGQSLVAEAGEQPFVYRFRVIQDPSLNAFAVFGGYIYFHSGTLLAAADVDELAGVMGHEVAHVRMRHHARIEKKTALPNLLANLASLATLGGAIAAGVNTDLGALVLAPQAINVAVQLHWSRSFEAEADRYGVEYTARAGYEAAGITRFFERVRAARDEETDTIPPYLYSHPAVDERIEFVKAWAATLDSDTRADPDLDLAFAAARERLALLLSSNRDHWIEQRQPDDVVTDVDTVHALDLAAAFRRGESLLASGDAGAAVEAFREIIRRDPARALTFFRLGEAYEALGDRLWAVWAYEHAVFRAGKKGALRRRAEWEVVKLTFPVVKEAALRAERRLVDGAASQISPGQSQRGEVTRLAWRARLGKRYRGLGARMFTRWSGPGIAGTIEVPVTQAAENIVTASLTLDPTTTPGPWIVTLVLDDDVVDTRPMEASAGYGI